MMMNTYVHFLHIGQILAILATVVTVAVLNRAAGSDLFGLKPKLRLPGKPLIYVAPLVGSLAYLWSGPQMAALPAWVSSPLPILPATLADALTNALLFLAPYRVGIALALAFWFWRVWPWGRWLYMDREPIGFGRTTPPGPLERLVEAVSLGSGRLAMFWRMQFGITGGMVLFYGQITLLVWLALGALLWAAYEAGWRLTRDHPVLYAEVISGWLWGLFIIGVMA